MNVLGTTIKHRKPQFRIHLEVAIGVSCPRKSFELEVENGCGGDKSSKNLSDSLKDVPKHYCSRASFNKGKEIFRKHARGRFVWNGGFAPSGPIL
jgi:uncharacterized protein YbbK (DUF523 family)